MNMITGRTKVIGIFGYPVEHSFSPLMQNQAFAATKLDYCYVPFPVAPGEVAEAVAAIRALGMRGINVTIPHKEAVLPFLDVLSVDAEIIGAVNTIVNYDGRLTGFNTDGLGFLEAMRVETGQTPSDKKVTMIGAGGAARAVAVQMALAGAKEIRIINRNLARADQIKAVLDAKTSCITRTMPFNCEDLADTIRDTDILINATPVGMYPKIDAAPVVEPKLLHSGMLVCDLVYNPPETGLLKAAKNKGAATLPGLGMLLYQGALAFKLWTDQEAPVEIMKEALKNFLHI